MTSVVRERLLETPAPFVLDLRGITDRPGPFLIALTYWTVTTDAGAGNFSATISWQDPIGQTRTATPGNINMNAAGAIASVGPVLVRCASGSSLFTLSSNYAGNPGSAKYAFSLLLSSGEVHNWE